MTLAQHSAANANWGTPSGWVERVRYTLGEIDLDPASSEEHNQVVKAKKYYTEKENALNLDWSGRVFLNPPGGRGVPKAFFQKLISEYYSGRVTSAVYLGYSLEQLLWIQRTQCWTAYAIPPRRIRFRGAGASPTHGNFFLLLSDEKEIHYSFHYEFRECLLLSNLTSV